MGGAPSSLNVGEDREGIETVYRPALRRGDSINFVAHDAAERAAETADSINDIVAPDLEARQRNLQLQNRQKVNTTTVGFGGSTTTVKKRIETVGPKAAVPKVAPKVAPKPAAEPLKKIDSKDKDGVLKNMFGSKEWNTLPLWKKAIERAKHKARLMINVTQAFAANAEVHPSKDYLQQLMAEMYDNLGADKAKYIRLESALIAAGGAPEPEKKKATGNNLSALETDDPMYVAKAEEASAPALATYDLPEDGVEITDPTDPQEIYGLMQTVLNRANAKALRGKTWAPPVVNHLLQWMGRDAREVGFFLEQAVTLLRSGELAIALSFAGSGLDLGLAEGTQSRPPIYMLDPWECAQSFSTTENLEFSLGSGYAHIEGLPLGSRALLRLTAAIQKWGGKLALNHVQLVLHVNTDELSSVLTDLKERKFYGLNRSNIYVVPEPPMPAFCFDAETKVLRPDERSQAQNYGPGYRLHQLGWRSEVVQIAEDGSQVLLEESLLDLMAAQGTKFMTWGPLDNHKLTEEGALDLEFLAFAIKLMEDSNGSMAVDVAQGPIAQARTCGSVVMRDQSQTGKASLHVTELRMSAFASASSAKVYERVAAQTPMPSLSGVSVPATYNSSHRYAFDVKKLAAILKHDMRWQMPMMTVQRNGSLRPLVCMEDVTAAPGAACVAIVTKNSTERLKKRSDIPALIHVVGEMDRDLKFQEHVAQFTSEQKPLMLRSDGEMVRYRVCVTALFDGPSKRAFLSVPHMLRPGVDKLEMVNMVRYLSEVPSAYQMLTTFELKGTSQFLELGREVRVLAPKQKIVDGISDYVDIKHPNLLVVGSDVNELGSNALAVAKQVNCPILIVKQRLEESQPIKYMVAIDTTSFPALKFTCSLMRPQDRLFLVRSASKDDAGGPTSHQQRLLNVFKDLAMGEGIRASQIPMIGKTLETLPKACSLNKIDVLVMQVAKLRTYSDTIKKITVATPASVMLFKYDAKDRDIVKIETQGSGTRVLGPGMSNGAFH